MQEKSGSWKGLLLLWPELASGGTHEIVQENLAELYQKCERTMRVKYADKIIAKFGEQAAGFDLMFNAADLENFLCKIVRYKAAGFV